MKDPLEEEREKCLQRVLAMLGEHYDGVQILVTRMGPDNCTQTRAVGSGNLLSRMMHAHLWADNCEREFSDPTEDDDDEESSIPKPD